MTELLVVFQRNNSIANTLLHFAGANTFGPNRVRIPFNPENKIASRDLTMVFIKNGVFVLVIFHFPGSYLYGPLRLDIGTVEFCL